MTLSSVDSPSAPWPMVPLKRVLTFRNGESYAHVESSDGDFPVYGSGGEFARADDYLHEGTSVLFGRKGTVDKPLLVHGRFWCIDTMFYTKPSPSVDPRFVHYFAKTIPYALLATDTARPSMTQTDLGEVKMPFPPLDRQVAIADFLDRETAQIDAMIGAQEVLLRTVRERRTAGLAARFDGTERHAPLRSGISYLTSGSRGWSGYAADEGEVFIRIGNLPRQDLGLRSEIQYVDLPKGVSVEGRRARVQVGDLLFSITAYLGSVGVVEGEPWVGGYVNQHVALCRLSAESGWLPRYVGYFILSPQGQDQLRLKGNGGTKQGLDLSDIRSLSVPRPSLEEQQATVDSMDRAFEAEDQLVAEIEVITDLLRQRREALITAAVTGRIDPETGIERIIEEGAA